ncbi:MAG: YgaP family membrane protein [Candidatus Saccharicenans sp.]|uniref:YgaP family membrane protein n=1 Tax=Candidatus Saccharicenans sp. TaxID=2819258 RepID=UPI004049352F
MKKNMGALDRTIRTLLAIIMAILVLAGVVKGMLAYILVILTVVFLVTSLAGFCPLYVPLGLSTLGKKKTEGQ